MDQSQTETDPPAASSAENSAHDRPRLIASGGSVDQIWSNGLWNRLPKLGEGPKRRVKSYLTHPGEISRDENPEFIRAVLPKGVSRVTSESSATLSIFDSEITHTQLRRASGLTVDPGNGFQAVLGFDPLLHLTPEAFNWQMKWMQKSNPSPYISVFNQPYIPHDQEIQMGLVEKRAHFHYHNSGHIGKRTVIAEISTAGLIAAKMKAHLYTEVWLKLKHKRWKSAIKAWKVHEVTIPVWIRKSAWPSDGSPFTHEHWSQSGAEMWLSMEEICRSDLMKIAAEDLFMQFDYEWLACGFIRQSSITRVMPYDGEKVHERPNGTVVRSIDSDYPWIFDWEISRWRLDAEKHTSEIFTPYHGKKKHKLADRDREGSKRKKKRVGNSETSILPAGKPVSDLKLRSSRNSKDSQSMASISQLPAEQTGCCTQDAQTSPSNHLKSQLHGSIFYLDLAVRLGKISREFD